MVLLTSHRVPCLSLLGVAALFFGAAGCDDDEAKAAQETIRSQHVPHLEDVVTEDIDRHREGIQDAAKRVAPGFLVEEAGKRESQMRTALKLIQEPPKGVPAFVASPMSFLAAIGPDGNVIARDAEPDRMRGEQFGKRYEAIGAALEQGGVHVGLGEFKSDDPSQPSSISILIAAPAERDGARVGAVVAGIPLWRMAQRLSRQLQAENADQEGTILWVFMYKGDQLFAPQVGLDLESLLPNAKARAAGLASSEDGYTGSFQQYGRPYAFGVFPAPSIGEGVGYVVVRADPSS